MANPFATWRHVTSPGDAAAVLLGGVAGWSIDAALNLHGVPTPGIVGAVSSAFALGVKKSVDIRVSKKRPLKRAQSARQFFLLKVFNEGVDLLEASIELYQNCLLTDAELNEAVTDAVALYRDSIH